MKLNKLLRRINSGTVVTLTEVGADQEKKLLGFDLLELSEPDYEHLFEFAKNYEVLMLRADDKGIDIKIVRTLKEMRKF